MKPKIIARYLPQFHRIPENDAWWGDGFTEWTAVKAAEQLFEGHQQPRVPLGDNYYNLMMKDTMVWQAKLAKKYSIDGLAFYHYWFKDGRRILEKPAENLLKWKDVEMPFCFSWANESWARTWSKLTGINAWSEKFEKNEKGKNFGDILLEQKYGIYKDWDEHIRYMIPFFKDSRYITHNGRPVFIILNPDQIHCLPDMLNYWNNVLAENDIPRLYIIGEVRNKNIWLSDSLNALDVSLIRYPDYFFSVSEVMNLPGGVSISDYDNYWNMLLAEGHMENAKGKILYCPAVDFDTTPRSGYKGRVLGNVTVEKFSRYFSQLYDTVCKNGDDYIFINAWNEWGEGMYLEPDKHNGYGYLEAIRNTVLRYSGASEAEKVFFREMQCKISPSNEQMAKTLSYYRDGVKSLNVMMDFREKGISIADCLKKYGYNNVAIYGYGYLGKYLYECLKQSCVKVSYVIDRNENVQCADLPVVQLSRDMPEVDVIIVTPAGKYVSIREDIHNIVEYNTISLEHIIYDLM